VPQCGPINSQIQQMRGNLDRATTDLEQLKSGTGSQDSQRRALIGQLAQNNCGAQYTAAANEAGPSGFFDKLFGGGAGGGSIIAPGGDGLPAGTFQTVCVRTCDGYYFPISYSTMSNRFADDERSCQRLCPAAEVALYSFHNPGEDIDQAVSVSGQPYTALPNAFHYRKEFTAACSCRKPGRRHRRHRPDREDAVASAAAQAGQRRAGCNRRSAGRRHNDACIDTCIDSRIRATGERLRHRSLQAHRADSRPAVRVAVGTIKNPPRRLSPWRH
jgi:hypothetical protein